jgi:ATP-dependent DNA ligase
MRTALPRSISFVTTANDRMFLYAFDLIELNGDDIRRDPLQVRKATLASILAEA